ncbi:SH3 domain-containing protein [Anaerococcus rubeinfantis]|uniref:SH3 domain-containing protein n=1 Tax=Anaerococcus rubeinfantis TaxID=1720199 RepID=UPI00073F392A|nr:SH3 domain-containing protein [Anaerococcus rubeinfantis]
MKIKYIVCSFALILALSSCEKKQEKYEQRDVKIDTVFDNSNSNVEIIDQNNNPEVNTSEENTDLNNNQGGETYRVTTSVNLRQTPTVDEDNYIDSIPANTEVVFIEEVENNDGETWSKITYKGKTGFVASDFLEKIVEN